MCDSLQQQPQERGLCANHVSDVVPGPGPCECWGEDEHPETPRDEQGMSVPTKGAEEGQCGWSKVSCRQRKNEGQRGNKGRGSRALVANMRI